ncbi:MAG: nuclear transport factor 2 family protein [Actinomycetota bacterium]|nr:nuclear transport factor 2 family protein [Actinomycetota bacterium]
MTVHPAPVDVLVAFTQAWTSHDMTTAAGCLADNVVYDGPVNHITGAGAYLEALDRFAQAVTGLDIVAAFGDDDQAVILYRVRTGPFGTLACGERVTVREGKIETDLLAFDTFAIRTAQAPRPASA